MEQSGVPGPATYSDSLTSSVRGHHHAAVTSSLPLSAGRRSLSSNRSYRHPSPGLPSTRSYQQQNLSSGLPSSRGYLNPSPGLPASRGPRSRLLFAATALPSRIEEHTLSPTHHATDSVSSTSKLAICERFVGAEPLSSPKPSRSPKPSKSLSHSRSLSHSTSLSHSRRSSSRSRSPSRSRNPSQSRSFRPSSKPRSLNSPTPSLKSSQPSGSPRPSTSPNPSRSSHPSSGLKSLRRSPESLKIPKPSRSSRSSRSSGPSSILRSLRIPESLRSPKPSNISDPSRSSRLSKTEPWSSYDSSRGYDTSRSSEPSRRSKPWSSFEPWSSSDPLRRSLEQSRNSEPSSSIQLSSSLGALSSFGASSRPDLESGLFYSSHSRRPDSLQNRARKGPLHFLIEKIKSRHHYRDYSPFHGFPLQILFLCFLFNLIYQLILPSLFRASDNRCYPRQFKNRNEGTLVTHLVMWSSAIISAGASFLVGQGLFGLRATRERMERVRQTAVTLGYSFLKTTGDGRPRSDRRPALETPIYECLALLTAYPVALLHQAKGNVYNPPVTKYCQALALDLFKIRNAANTDGWSQPTVTSSSVSSLSVSSNRSSRRPPSSLATSSWTTEAASVANVHAHYDPVESFFEHFSRRLEKEFNDNWVRGHKPPVTTQYIIYNLRNHFENLADQGDVDDRRTPIIRENIDILALAGRESMVYAGRNVVPICMLWTVYFCCFALIMLLPVKHCNWIMHPGKAERPQLRVSFTLALMVVICTFLMLLLVEMRSLWDPFRTGIRTCSLSLGIASEIDQILNEFYEQDTSVLVRKHAYMPGLPDEGLDDFYEGDSSVLVREHEEGPGRPAEDDSTEVEDVRFVRGAVMEPFN